MRTTGAVEIAQNTWWIGGNDQDGGLHRNPYLIVDGDEAVLIDPGSALDFAYVYDNICSIIPIEKVKYVILHQDPDLCSGVPLFEQKGLKFKVVTHWKAQTLVKYYGIKSAYYLVDNHAYQLTLKSGRKLDFIRTPYLRFAGAVTTYDHTSEILFSGDLFGAFSYDWSLYANEGYLEKMKIFHAYCMPSIDIMRPLMESFLNLDISLVAPQRGSIIKDDIKKYIEALRDLTYGTLLTPIRNDFVRSGGYLYLCSSVLKKYAGIYGSADIDEIVSGIDMDLDEDLNITGCACSGEALWDLVFQRALACKGISWLLVMEPFVRELAEEYDIPLPKVFESSLMHAQGKAESLGKENLLLKSSNQRLMNSLKESEYKLTRCPVTGLYNLNFFTDYLSSQVRGILRDNLQQNPGLLLISVDGMLKFREAYGEKETDEMLANIAYLLESLREGDEVFFRLHDSLFACYLADTDAGGALAYGEKVRNAAAVSEKFLSKVTVSIGVVCLDELRKDIECLSSPDKAFYKTAAARVRLAKGSGMDTVCASSPIDTDTDKSVRILVVDTDAVNLDVLKTSLENQHYEVLTAGDGETAASIAEVSRPDLIISEIMLAQTDGFQFYEKLLSQSGTKAIPFFIVSYLKDEASVEKALSLGIEQYFKKPFMLSELMGAVKNKLKESAVQ